MLRCSTWGFARMEDGGIPFIKLFEIKLFNKPIGQLLFASILPFQDPKFWGEPFFAVFLDSTFPMGKKQYYLVTKAAFPKEVYIVRKVFHVLSISLLYPKESLTSNFKTAGKKNFFNGATSNWFLLLCKQKNSISMNQQILSFKFENNLTKKS